MRAQALGRLIDPQTRRCVAAFGWLRETKHSTDRYWVSIDGEPYQWFATRELAREFYTAAVAPLKARLRARKFKQHKQTLAALAGA